MNNSLDLADKMIEELKDCLPENYSSFLNEKDESILVRLLEQPELLNILLDELSPNHQLLFSEALNIVSKQKQIITFHKIVNDFLELPLNKWRDFAERNKEIIEKVIFRPLQEGTVPTLYLSAELIPPDNRLHFFKYLGAEMMRKYIDETGVFSLLFSLLNNQEQHEFSLLLGEGVVKTSYYVDNLLEERYLDHHLKLFFLLYALDTETLLQSIKTLKDRNTLFALCDDDESKALLERKAPIELFQVDSAAEQLANLGLHSHADKPENKTDLSSSAKRRIQTANQ